jgi:type II secretory pathway component PulC
MTMTLRKITFASLVAAALTLATTIATSASAQNRPDSSSSNRSTRTATAAPKPPSYSEKYAALEEKNIFQKTRVRRDVRTSSQQRSDQPPRTTGSEPSRRRIEESFVLTGITMQEGRHVAFVENTSAYTTSRLTPGEAVAGGKIVTVERDHVEYETNGQRTRVEIGHNFAGGLAAVTSPASGSSTAMTITGTSSAASGTASTQSTTGPTTATAGAAPDPNNPNLNIEERMRLRRMQEQKK